VETIKTDLQKALVGEKLISLDYQIPKMLRPSPETVLKEVVGKEILSFSRIGKLLLINFKEGGSLAIHLKLSGRLFLRSSGDAKDKYTYVVFHFDNGRELRFTEMRKFGFVKYIRDEGEKDLIASGYGPEPLSSQFTIEALAALFKKTTRAVKTVIMDQKKIAGIGNIYADEALWYSKIHPARKADSLTKKEIESLFKSINLVIKQGIEDRGTTVDSYVDANGIKGKHDQRLQVFRRDKQPCPRCATIIKKIRVGGRGTHLCPKEQIYHD
jgi:formamidopyrimidine-DNA glycosylase